MKKWFPVVAVISALTFCFPANAEIIVEQGMELNYISDQLIFQLPEQWEREDDTDYFLNRVKKSETSFSKDGECVCRIVIMKPDLYKDDLGDIRDAYVAYDHNSWLSYDLLCAIFEVDEVEYEETFSFGGISGEGVSLASTGEIDGKQKTVEAMSVFQTGVWYAVILYADGNQTSAAARGNSELMDLISRCTYTTVIDGDVYEDEETVRAVQEALNEKMYECQVDGEYGPSTEKAIREFQEGEGSYMNINGVITDSLLDDLDVYHTLAGTY